MRILKLSIAVALLAGSLGMNSAATAQQVEDRHGRVVDTGPGSDYRRDVLGIPNGRTYGESKNGRNDRYNNSDRRRDDRRYDRSNRRRDDSRYNRSDRRRDNYRNARSCKTVWRNERRVRVCR